MTKKPADQFTPEETQKRFEAALRGARIAGHKSKPAASAKRKKRAKKAPARKRK